MIEVFVTAVGLSVFQLTTMQTLPAPEDFFGVPMISHDGSLLAPICVEEGDGICDRWNIQVELEFGQEYNFIMFYDGEADYLTWRFHPADVNMDDRVNFYDVVYFNNNQYDYNLDGSVDTLDVLDLMRSFQLPRWDLNDVGSPEIF